MGGSGTGEGTQEIPISSAGAGFCYKRIQIRSLGPDSVSSCLLEGNLRDCFSPRGELLGTEARVTNHCLLGCETMVLCGHPAHRAAAAALPPSLSHCLRAPGRSTAASRGRHPGTGHRGWQRARAGETVLPFTPFIRCGEVEGRHSAGGSAESWGRTDNSLRRQSCHLGAKLKSRKKGRQSFRCRCMLSAFLNFPFRALSPSTSSTLVLFNSGTFS